MASTDRDRREDGRPEQSRPRDRTGRPLPYGTDDRPLAEDHGFDTVEEALNLGVRLWNEQRFFEAHECLEAVWHASPGSDQDLWQGVIQVAVAAVHVQRGNPVGAVKLAERAAERLASYPAEHRGIDVDSARRTCERLAAQVEEEGVHATELPGRFPATTRGAWFTPDPAALQPPSTPTPVPDEPVWLAAGKPRSPNRR